MKVRDKEYLIVEQYKKSMVDDNVAFANDYETIAFLVSNNIATEIDDLFFKNQLDAMSVHDLITLINKYLITVPLVKGEERIKPLEEYYIKELKDFTRHQIKTINNNIYVDEVFIEGIVRGLSNEISPDSPISNEQLKDLIASISFKIIESLYKANPGYDTNNSSNRGVELQTSKIVEKYVVALKESSDSLYQNESLSLMNKTRNFKSIITGEIQIPKNL